MSSNVTKLFDLPSSISPVAVGEIPPGCSTSSSTASVSLKTGLIATNSASSGTSTLSPLSLV